MEHSGDRAHIADVDAGRVLVVHTSDTLRGPLSVPLRRMVTLRSRLTPTHPRCGLAVRTLPRGARGRKPMRRPSVVGITMTEATRRPLVLIAGGGVAALEAVRAFEALAGARVRMELLTP
jgi:hypothetical protein